MPRKSYDDLVLIPSLIAKTVAQSVYTGQEISLQMRSQSNVERVEKLRANMTPVQLDSFINYSDNFCRAAYTVKSAWFMKIIRSRSNRGRDQLYAFVSHWLAAYLTREEEGKEQPWYKVN